MHFSAPQIKYLEKAILNKKSKVDVAKKLGISRKTLYKWIIIYKSEIFPGKNQDQFDSFII